MLSYVHSVDLVTPMLMNTVANCNRCVVIFINVLYKKKKWDLNQSKMESLIFVLANDKNRWRNLQKIKGGNKGC